jgi:hypothetical protein
MELDGDDKEGDNKKKNGPHYGDLTTSIKSNGGELGGILGKEPK